MKTKRLKFLLFCTILSLLPSCSNFTVSTNLDKEKIKDYFAPSTVTIYKNDAQLPSVNKYISAVEGESCQIKTSDAPANKVEARTQARINAYHLQANAVVFSHCAQTQTKECQQLLICYAKAYKVQKN